MASKGFSLISISRRVDRFLPMPPMIVLAWKVAGWWGLDRWALPLLGTPWQRIGTIKKE